MLEDVRKAFGLKDEDETIAVILVLLLVLLIGIVLFRGCAPTNLSVDGILPAGELASDIAAPVADTPIVRTDFAGGLVTFSGSAEPNSELDLFLNGDEIGTTTVDPFGNWSFATRVTDPGDYSLQLTERGDDFELDSAAYPFVIAGAAIAASNLDEAAADVSPTPTESSSAGLVAVATEEPTVEPTIPATVEPTAIPIIAPTLNRNYDGKVFEAGTFRLQGTGTPGSTIDVLANGAVVGSAVVNRNGLWLTDIDLDANGNYEFVAQVQDAAGNTLASDAVSFGIGQSRLVPTLDTPGPDSAPDSIALTGTGTPGSTITIFRNGDEIGSTTVDADGTWNFDTDTSTYRTYFRATSTLAGDDLGNTATKRLIFTGLIAPVTLIGTAASDFVEGEEGQSAGELSLSGQGEPGFTVNIFANDEQIGSARVGEDGTWSFTDGVSFAPGQVGLKAVQVAANGEDHSTSSEELVDVPDLAPAVVEATPEPEEPATGSLSVAFAEGAGPIAGAGSDDNGDGNGADGSGDVAASVEFILDASWSMRIALDLTDDESGRIFIAKDALEQAVTNTIPDNTPVALRAFGHIEPNFACDTALEVPLGPIDKTSFLQEVDDVFPRYNSNTPIAASLAAVAEDMAGATGPVVVILLTDGEETCDGDPAAEIESLQAQGIQVQVNIIGVVIDDDALRGQFESWAELGGGNYYDAADADTLSAAINDIYAQLPSGEAAPAPVVEDVPFRVLDADGNVVVEGVVGQDAVELPEGAYTIEVGSDAITTYDVEVSGATEFVIEE